MTITKIYYYLFYKFYKLFKAIRLIDSFYDSKAIIVLMILEFMIILSLYNYWDVLRDQSSVFEINSIKFLVPFILIVFIKWLAFWRNDNWKNYINKFDEQSRETNITGTWVVIGMTLLIVADFIFSSYLNPPIGGWR